MKKERRNNLIKLIIAIIIILLLLRGCDSTLPIGGEKVRAESGTSTSQIIPSDENSAVVIRFADKDKVELGANTMSLLNIFSTVTPQSGVPVDNVFFFILIPRAIKAALLDMTVWVEDLKIYEPSGSEITGTLKESVISAWGCKYGYDNRFTLTSAMPSQEWDPYICNGQNAWVDTTQFEALTPNLDDYVTFTFTLKGTYTNFVGITQEITKQASIMLNFQEGSFEEAAFTAEVLWVDEAAISECNPCGVPDIADCAGNDVPLSSCEGLMQECYAYGSCPDAIGLFPGCSQLDYINHGNSIGRTFTGAYEFTGSPGWKELCLDGYDNDCDGYIDKFISVDKYKDTGIPCSTQDDCYSTHFCDGSTCRVYQDGECPTYEVKFRTNVDFEGDPYNDNIERYGGKWVNVDYEGSGVISSFGCGTGTGTSSGSSCDVNYNPSNIIALSPQHPINKVIVRSSSDSKIIIYQLQSDATCKIKECYSSSSSRCKLGDADYPSCLNSNPTPPWSFNGQETQEMYCRSSTVGTGTDCPSGQICTSIFKGYYCK